ncbi:MAG: hypothetical protein R3D51_17855 [Hyphomicrobiaceae bacterium]
MINIKPPAYPLEDSPAKFAAAKAILTGRGYTHIKKRAEREYFRAPWSTEDVQHLVIATNGGRSKQGLGLRYALYNDELEQFSVDCVVIYRRLDPSDWTKNKRGFCALAFATFTRARQGPGRSPWGIFLCDYATDEIVAMVKDKLDREIEPSLKSVTDIRTWFEALATDSDAFPWWQVSPEVRAAQAVALGARLGMSDQEIKDKLMLQKAHIAGPAIRGFSAEEYLDFVIQAAQKFKPN